MLFDFFRRINLKRMRNLVNIINIETKIPKVFIFFDMIWCYFVYGTGYLEYRVFGFVRVRGKRRRTFLTSKHSEKIVKILNNPSFFVFFGNKIKFCEKFDKFLGRNWIDIKNSKFEEFEEFINKFIEDKNFFFAKSPEGCGGKAVKKIYINSESNFHAIRQKLLKRAFYLCEEALIQNEEMSRLCSVCINTIRIVTVLTNGVVKIMYTLVRIGDGEHDVDNISSGGMYCPIGEDAVIYASAFRDSTGCYYEQHPFSGVKFVGFKIPFYEEILALIKKAALVVPEIRYVGWDVAITVCGPVLIEGNVVPGYDMCQNYLHLRDKKEGILEKFLKVL
jgi:glutathione synthase/RimK-type ligase-like ATP-grasp enzyme